MLMQAHVNLDSSGSPLLMNRRFSVELYSGVDSLALLVETALMVKQVMQAAWASTAALLHWMEVVVIKTHLAEEVQQRLVVLELTIPHIW